jgi:aminoglycoside phosphotransferase (APT) family kinase protein
MLDSLAGRRARANVVVPLAAHRIDEASLFSYLAGHVEGFTCPAALWQFQGGQSNPTYLIETADHAYVLRKKPPGALLPSAHQIDREFRIQRALMESDVPVARMVHYCVDTNIIGTEFYVMAYLEGRVLHDPMLGDFPADERATVQAALFETMGALHAVDYAAVGLKDYGRPQHYIARQMKRWRTQYESIATEELTDMTRLMDWLARNIPARDESRIVHGDFRLGNMMIHPDEPRLIAVLDWELSTIGHPLADLGYACMVFHLPQRPGSTHAGYAGVNLAGRSMLNEAACLEIYCRRTGRSGIPDWKFHLGFAMFRAASIAEGVYVRARAGNAADASGIALHEMTKISAECGWDVVQGNHNA